MQLLQVILRTPVLQELASVAMHLRPIVFIALIACAAGGACPIDNFIGNWTGSCVQTIGMKESCANATACAAAGLGNMRLSPGWDFATGVSSCTQRYDFSFWKVGTAVWYEFTSGAFVSPCTNAITPFAALFPFLQRGLPSQQSFSTSTAATIIPSQAFFGTNDPCYIITGSTPPTATSAGTFFASATADGKAYREYGSYNSDFAYQSPAPPHNAEMFTSAVPNSTYAWDKYGQMYSNIAISARPAGSPPLASATTLYQGAGTPVFSYKCTAKKIDAVAADTNKKSRGCARTISLSLLILSMLAGLVMPF
jgi:hypothetical protein